MNGLTVVSLGSLAFGVSWGAAALLASEISDTWGCGCHWLEGRGVGISRPARSWVSPKYVLWKLPSYLGFLGKARSLGWVRAERR
ncbi:MAG: hypothetical protein QM784_00410 [Polyangiaceae bacterium]